MQNQCRPLLIPEQLREVIEGKTERRDKRRSEPAIQEKNVNFLNKPNNFETEFDQENARAVHKTTSKRREGTETA